MADYKSTNSEIDTLFRGFEIKQRKKNRISSLHEFFVQQWFENRYFKNIRYQYKLKMYTAGNQEFHKEVWNPKTNS